MSYVEQAEGKYFDDLLNNEEFQEDLKKFFSGGIEIDASNSFPKGMTIYGRWTSIELNSTGTVLAYIG